MQKFGSNFALSRFPSHGLAHLRFLGRFLCLLLFAGFLAGSATAADVPNAPAASLGSNLSFSIADLDGDSKPDLASVQAGKGDPSRTDYWIQLQLSAAGRQTFQIVAPMGGLQIVARDVNGDHALDLVLTAAWLRQPVAILLNDGHGVFSRVEPDAFPEAFTESERRLCSTTERATDSVGAPPQPREDICSGTEIFRHLRSQTQSLASSDLQFRVGPFLVSHLGRAPPFESSHS